MGMMPIRFLTIHCAATPEGRDVTAATIAAWGRARFGQESYHHIVTLDGTDHVRLADDRIGAHVARHNSGNIGVCYVGGCDREMRPKDTRTDAQKRTLRDLVASYRRTFPGLVVRGHRDWPGVSKACPSFDVSTQI
jgi:N-acetylmuramoyl-L-alanine amidase